MASTIGIESSRRPARVGLMLRVALCLGVGWLACGGSSDEGLESPLEGAGSVSDPDCLGYPVSVTLGQTGAWGRNPSTGTCCAYRSLAYLPDNFPYFETLEACETSCRCGELIPDRDFEGVWNLERVSIECFCSDQTCPASFEAVVEEQCSGGSMVRSEGCGLRMIAPSSPYLGNAWVFDQASGALVGAGFWNDVPYGTCRAFGTEAGSGVIYGELDCPEVTHCQVCGNESQLPPCD